MPTELRAWVIAQVGKQGAQSMSAVINDLVRVAKQNDNRKGK
jgi:hypothetical protein